MQDSSIDITNLFLASTVIVLLLIALTAFFIVIYQRRVMAQKTLMQMLQADALRQKLVAIVDTQEAERIRIARDLHDEVGGMLSAVKMSIKLSERKLEKGVVPGVNFAESSNMLDLAIESVRRISHDLLPPSLENLGLDSALQALTAHTSQLSGIPFKYYNGTPASRLSIRAELGLYRIVQELINNSLKHSHTQNLGLELSWMDGSLRIEYNDDGLGFDVAATKESGFGSGIKGMESRVEVLGGRLDMQSLPGKGSTTIILVPIQ